MLSNFEVVFNEPFSLGFFGKFFVFGVDLLGFWQLAGYKWKDANFLMHFLLGVLWLYLKNMSKFTVESLKWATILIWDRFETLLRKPYNFYGSCHYDF
jgi:hypothetical protein